MCFVVLSFCNSLISCILYCEKIRSKFIYKIVKIESIRKKFFSINVYKIYNYNFRNSISTIENTIMNDYRKYIFFNFLILFCKQIQFKILILLYKIQLIFFSIILSTFECLTFLHFYFIHYSFIFQQFFTIFRAYSIMIYDVNVYTLIHFEEFFERKRVPYTLLHENKKKLIH